MQQKDWKDQLNSFFDINAELQSSKNEQTKEISALSQQSFYIELDKKGRKGKQATLISGFQGNEQELKDFTANLKKICGVGGSFRDKEILIQGDCREKLITLLTKMGHKAKRIN